MKYVSNDDDSSVTEQDQLDISDIGQLQLQINSKNLCFQIVQLM